MYGLAEVKIIAIYKLPSVLDLLPKTIGSSSDYF